MPRITTFMAYDDQAEEAAKFYISVFKNSRIRSVTLYGEAGPGPKGSVMTVAFESGQRMMIEDSTEGVHMRYVDGYVLPVPKKNLRAYRQMAQNAAKVWRKYGALEYLECVGDDLNPKWAGIKFPRTVRAKPGETVVFSFVVFKSRAHRDRVNAKVMKDPLMNDPAYKDKPMPFDMKRMVYGGFKALVEA